MIAPLSWLKEYIDITSDPKKLGDRLTEIGLGTEKIIKVNGDTIFEFEITPNRPDLLSMIGIAREIAAVEQQTIRFPKLITNLKPGSHLSGRNRNNVNRNILPLKIETNPAINPRFTGIIIDGITVKDSPLWLVEQLIKIGQRPINNIVDITNYVMFELGNPIHAFDYDKIKGKTMRVHQTKGGEQFRSVDGISYPLPRGAVVISDSEGIIDLCGIKGGGNTGTYKDAKTIFIRVPVEIPQLIRRASQSLGLRSEASSIFERGVNKGGTIDALKRTVDLILEYAGGEIASELYDLKKEDFKPWKLSVSIDRLNKILGIEIPQRKVLSILESLNLSPRVILGRNASDDSRIRSTDSGQVDSGPALPAGRQARMTIIECTIPTYRNDLQIEEDLIEEVARIYGYNNFPKTIPQGQIPTQKITYFKDYRREEKAKQLLTGAGFSEIYTYSLISEKDAEEGGLKPEQILRVDNPVSREYEYLRPTLKTNLIKALGQNKPNFKSINVFELGRIYTGKTLDSAKEENMLSGISNSNSYLEIKGILERLFSEFGVQDNPVNYIQILEEGVFFEISFDSFIKKSNLKKTFKPLPKYPPVIEDLALVVRESIKTGNIIEEIKQQSDIIEEVSLLDKFENTRTFHIVYQHPQRNLSSKDIAPLRDKIITSLSKKFAVKLKE